GFGGPGAVRASMAVTFTAVKRGMTRANSGRIVLRDIGIPPAAIEQTGPGEYLAYPLRAPAARAARIVIVGGGPYSGAPALSALAALRAGAERATILCPSSVVASVRAASPTLVVHAIGEDRFRAAQARELIRFLAANRHDALAIGMGAGRERSTVSFFREVLRALPPGTPVVVDADALESALELPGRASWLLTPNEVELLRITGARRDGPAPDREKMIHRFLRGRRCAVLAKGDPDRVGFEGRFAVNRCHHPAGMVSGAGDVLDGVLATLLGAGAEPWEAARLGAYWVGDASSRVERRLGYGLIATDIIEELPAALRAAGRPGPAGPPTDHELRSGAVPGKPGA
ncbi:MAG: NAD(P)H-hydrate dehydratase, partial [Thermoplasmata archaeon]